MSSIPTDSIPGRVCSKCKTWKEARYYPKSKIHKGGMYPSCSDCKNGQRKDARKSNPDHSRNYAKSRRLRYPDKYKEYDKTKRARHSEKIAIRKSKYYKDNTAQVKSYIKTWRRGNPEKVYKYHQERRARELNAEGIFTYEEWEALKNEYNYRCLRCGRREPDILLTPDHVIPLIKGGSNYIDNIQPLCFSCNSSKRAKITDYRLNSSAIIS